MSAKTRRFVPRLESFDDRIVPAVMITQFDTIVVIEGDDAPDQFAIFDDGSAGGVVVKDAAGQTIFTGSGTITNIVVNTGGGNDVVDYWLTNTLTVDRTLSLDLGRKNDTFAAHLSGRTLGAGAELFISAHSQMGNDHLILDAQGVNSEAGARLAVDYSGGKGKDTVDISFSRGDMWFGQPEQISGVA